DMRKLRRIAGTVGIVAASVSLGGCNTMGLLSRGSPGADDALPETNLYAEIPQGKLNSASRKLAAEGLKAIDSRDYKKASELFNLAVKTDITNSYLHFLNGFAYQIR